MSIALIDEFELLSSFVKYFNTGSVRTYNKITILNLGKDLHLVNFLKDFGLADTNKTFNAYIPFVENKECFCMLLRGYIDGDGNIRKSIFRAFTASEKLRDSLFLSVKHHFNFNLTISKTKNGYTLASRKAFLKDLHEVYNNFPEFVMRRKKNILNKYMI